MCLNSGASEFKIYGHLLKEDSVVIFLKIAKKMSSFEQVMGLVLRP